VGPFLTGGDTFSGRAFSQVFEIVPRRLMYRTALDGFLLEAFEKCFLLDLINWFLVVYLGAL
jgi:hypothetical protein